MDMVANKNEGADVKNISTKTTVNDGKTKKKL